MEREGEILNNAKTPISYIETGRYFDAKIDIILVISK